MTEKTKKVAIVMGSKSDEAKSSDEAGSRYA